MIVHVYGHTKQIRCEDVLKASEQLLFAFAIDFPPTTSCRIEAYNAVGPITYVSASYAYIRFGHVIIPQLNCERMHIGVSRCAWVTDNQVHEEETHTCIIIVAEPHTHTHTVCRLINLHILWGPACANQLCSIGMAARAEWLATFRQICMVLRLLCACRLVRSAAHPSERFVSMTRKLAITKPNTCLLLSVRPIDSRDPISDATANGWINLRGRTP